MRCIAYKGQKKRHREEWLELCSKSGLEIGKARVASGKGITSAKPWRLDSN